MSRPWRAVPPRDGVVVIVGVDDPDPTPEQLDRLAAALGRSGLDALGRWTPAVDALVRVDVDGRVAAHLDRSGHGRLGLPQVLREQEWNRFLSAPPTTTDELPAVVVGRLGGRIGMLDEEDLRGS